jgi:hypothetical protein
MPPQPPHATAPAADGTPVFLFTVDLFATLSEVESYLRERSE